MALFERDTFDTAGLEEFQGGESVIQAAERTQPCHRGSVDGSVRDVGRFDIVEVFLAQVSLNLGISPGLIL
jgi:hypothetical protein